LHLVAINITSPKILLENTGMTKASQENTAFRCWREQLGIAIAEAGPLLGKHRATLLRIERGDYPPPLTLRLLMTAISQGQRPRLWPV